MCDLPLDEDNEKEKDSDIDGTSTRHQGTFAITTLEPL